MTAVTRPPFSADPFVARRVRLADALRARGGGVALLATAPEQMRNRDVDHPYRHDSHFFYLTGFTEPEALLALRVGRDGAARSVLFCRPKDETREIWDGVRHGPAAAQAVFGVDAAHPLDALDAELPGLLADQPALYLPLAASTAVDAPLARALDVLRAQARAGVRVPASRHDLLPLLDEMRLVKDAHEAAAMRSAGRIAAAAHRRAMRACRPGLREHQLEAELLHAFHWHGALPAYNAVVAAGANACVLHHRAGHGELRDGELCLIDAGCEFDSYASDITRTFPVNGRFSGPQRAVYDIVLAAQAAAIAATRPGVPFKAPHTAALHVLVRGLVDLELLDGSVDGAIESEAYRQFYMHGTGHWLGLDVHDVGDYLDPAAPADADGKRPSRLLQPGMAITVEPGLYLRPAPNVPAAFEHIGIRIEDDVLVDSTGCEVLTADAPKAADEIEALMRG